MKTQVFSIILPAGILAAALAVSTGQKAKKGSTLKPGHAEKVAGAMPDKAPAKPKEARKVLVFSKTAGFRHGSIPTGVEAMRQMGKATGAFEVTATEDESFFEAEKLKEFDAVVFLNTTGEVFK